MGPSVRRGRYQTLAEGNGVNLRGGFEKVEIHRVNFATADRIWPE
jgi:hypothetical protein